MKIVIMEPLGISNDELNELTLKLRKNNSLVIYDDKTTLEDELIRRAEGAEVIIIANNPLSSSVIKALPNLKMISVAFVGIDHIDIEVCKSQNIRITNAAGYCTHAVAELAIGLTLSVLRNIPRCDTATRNLLTKDGLVGHELHKKTFGVIGTGAIGIRTAEIAQVFGCNVIAHSRSQNQKAINMGIEYVSLETLMSTADIISVHAPLTEKTKHLLNEDKLNLMKSTSILINTARGPIVDNDYLSKLLRENRIAGAGIDVFDIEPPLSSSASLIHEPTAVLTPHVAYATKESILRRAFIVVENVEKWIEGSLQNIML